MKKLIFICVFILTFISLVYFDSNKSIYAHWYKDKSGAASLFGSEINTVKLYKEKNSKERFFVLYDENNKGMYCSKVEGAKKFSVCIPIELAKQQINKNDYLADVIKTAKNKEAFFAEISYINFAFFKMLYMKTAPFDLECLGKNNCPFEDMDRYASFDYDIARRIYISIKQGID